jgi:hypothetical protein
MAAGELEINVTVLAVRAHSYVADLAEQTLGGPVDLSDITYTPPDTDGMVIVTGVVRRRTQTRR